MSNKKTDTKKEIAKSKAQLAIFEEIDLLESEFRLIKNEYFMRLEHYKNKLKKVDEEYKY